MHSVTVELTRLLSDSAWLLLNGEFLVNLEVGVMGSAVDEGAAGVLVVLIFSVIGWVGGGVRCVTAVLFSVISLSFPLSGESISFYQLQGYDHNIMHALLFQNRLSYWAANNENTLY